MAESPTASITGIAQSSGDRLKPQSPPAPWDRRVNAHVKIQFNSAIGAGKLRRAHRLFREDGRAVLVAIDHAAYMGTGPVEAAIEAIAAGRPDGILASWHVARSHAESFVDAGLILRVDGGISELRKDMPGDVSSMLYRAEQALAIGADAVVALAFPGAPNEQESLQRLARLCSECELLGLPVMGEMIPGGWGQEIPWTSETVARAARIGVELGADIIKTVCPEDPSEFSAVVKACPAPVVVLGGPKMARDDEVVALARGVV